MPKKANVPLSEIIQTLVENQCDVRENYQKPSSEIWMKMAQCLSYKISPKSIYTMVNRNRHNVRVILGIEVTSSDKVEKEHEEDSDSSFSLDDHSQDVLCKQLNLSSLEWNKIKPISVTSRGSLKLQIGWAETLYSKLAEYTDNNCFWTFKRHAVSNYSNCYLKVDGKCAECDAKISILSKAEPHANEGLTGIVKIWSVNASLHTYTKKRQLRGEMRKTVGNVLSDGKLAVNWQREYMYNAMKNGSTCHENMHSLEVLRKCKQEASSKKMPDIKKNHSCFDNLLRLKYTQPYSSAVHFIALDKFILHYWSPEQFLLYKWYLKNTKESVLAIDATGSLISKLDRPLGATSGHIFLYSAVIHMKSTKCQIPVTQMLSESHDTNAIAYWLESWKKYGACSTKIIVCDHSLALLGAISWTFAEMKLKMYLQLSWGFLTECNSNTPAVLLKIDYNHMIGIIKRWDCIKRPRLLKEFYVRCMILLIKCKTLQEAEELLTNVLTVCNSEYSGHNTPCELRKKKLKTLLSGLEDIDLSEEEFSTDNTEKTIGYHTVEHIQDESPSNILIWFDNIHASTIKQCCTEADEENYYYCPELTVKLRNIMKTFVLWSAVMHDERDCLYSTYSSNSVESYFNDLKSRTLKQFTTPLPVDKFFLIHYESLQGMVGIAATKCKTGKKL